MIRLQYFIITILRNLIISAALSQSLLHVLLLATYLIFQLLAATFRTTLYHLHQL